MIISTDEVSKEKHSRDEEKEKEQETEVKETEGANVRQKTAGHQKTGEKTQNRK